jgi:hypothetical protein
MRSSRDAEVLALERYVHARTQQWAGLPGQGCLFVPRTHYRACLTEPRMRLNITFPPAKKFAGRSPPRLRQADHSRLLSLTNICLSARQTQIHFIQNVVIRYCVPWGGFVSRAARPCIPLAGGR